MNVATSRLVIVVLGVLALAVMALPVLMPSRASGATALDCPYATAPFSLCDSDTGGPGSGPGPSPIDYPVGLPGLL